MEWDKEGNEEEEAEMRWRRRRKRKLNIGEWREMKKNHLLLLQWRMMLLGMRRNEGMARRKMMTSLNGYG
jgi:hypothetical protein